MALEVTSGAVSGLQKVAKPVEMPEQRSVEKAADVSNVSTSAQIERRRQLQHRMRFVSNPQ